MSGNDENRSCVAVFVCDVICVSNTRYLVIFQGRSKVRLYARQERKPELCIIYIRVYNAETAQSLTTLGEPYRAQDLRSQ